MEKDLINSAYPKRRISLLDSVVLITGIVIGAGIFRTPSLVAAHTANESMFFLTWILGGIISLTGALCYAELSTSFPDTGGDYHFIKRAYGEKPAFLFAWARMSVIQTGSIALLAYIFGDYMSQVYNLGEYSSVIYAALIIILLTLINIAGIGFGTGTQRLFTLTEVGGVLIVVVAGLFISPAAEATAFVPNESSSIGLAMVFVLLTFGGWNEAAYISAELKSGSITIVKSLIISLLIITSIYILINMAYIKVLGHSGLGQSTAAGADVLDRAWGQKGTYLIGMIVAISALTSVNATIFTGARTNYALGKDFRIFTFLGRWNSRSSGPVNAFLVQGIIALALTSLGIFTRSGFESIIEYTAPVFWFFFLLTGIALFVLRKKEPDIKRPFKVPFYPVIPLIFCLSSAYLFYSSLMYTGLGAMIGVYVLLTGVIILIVFRKMTRTAPIIKSSEPSLKSDVYK